MYFGGTKTDSKSDARGFRTKDYTYAIVKDKDGEKFHYLYHDAKDPFQMENIWGKDATLDIKMEKELATLLTSMNDPWSHIKPQHENK